MLRPALLSGLIYGCAAFNFLSALIALPYAVGYGLAIGGGLAVSHLCGIFVFAEAAGDHNRRCVCFSLAGVISGAVFLVLSA